MIDGNLLADPGLACRLVNPQMVASAVASDVLMPEIDPDHAAPALDAAALAKLTKLDPTGQSGLLARVLTAYLASLRRLRQQMDAMGRDIDLGGLSTGVHTLKSSSASVGALNLARLCANIEQAARHQRVDGLAEQVGQLKVEIDRVERAIQQMIANPTPRA